MTTMTTSTARYLATCDSCGWVNAATASHGSCENCAAGLTLVRIRGTFTDTPCDLACMGAHGPTCQCQCGGENHAIGYRLGTIPAEVREADAARHAAKLAAAAAVAAAEQVAADAARDALVAEHPDLAALLPKGDRSDFLTDMRRALLKGSMTPRQIEVAVRCIRQDAERAARDAARAAARTKALKAGVTPPTGRATVKGTIRSVVSRDGYAWNSTEWKVTIDAEDGYAVWMTCPSSWIDTAMDEQDAAGANREGAAFRGWSSFLSGRAVEVTVTLEPSDRDPLFAFGKRPSKPVLHPAA